MYAMARAVERGAGSTRCQGPSCFEGPAAALMLEKLCYDAMYRITLQCTRGRINARKTLLRCKVQNRTSADAMTVFFFGDTC